MTAKTRMGDRKKTGLYLLSRSGEICTYPVLSTSNVGVFVVSDTLQSLQFKHESFERSQKFGFIFRVYCERIRLNILCAKLIKKRIRDRDDGREKLQSEF